MAADIAWGIDIGRSGIKAVKLARRKGQVQVAQVDMVPFKGQPSEGEQIGRDRLTWKGLVSLETRNKIGHEHIGISVPGTETFVRKLDIPQIGRKSIHELARLEAQQAIPFVLDEVIWDYQLFEGAEGEKLREGLLFAVKKNVLNNYALSLSSAHLSADTVQTAPLAVYNFFRYDQKTDGGCLVVDVGAESTNLVAIGEGRFWVRSLSLGGSAVTRALVSQFGLEFQKAEVAKINIAKSSHAQQILEIIRPQIQTLITEIDNSIKFQNTGGQSIEFRQVYLVGGGARLIGLRALLQRQLGVEVTEPKRFGRIVVSKGANVELISKHFSSFATALGLGIQALGLGSAHVDFVPRSAARSSLVSRKKPWVAATTAAVAVFLCAMFGFGKYRQRQLSAACDAARSVMETNKDLEAKLNRARNVQTIENKLRKVLHIGAERKLALLVLDELAKILPDNASRLTRAKDRVWLVSLSLEPEGEGLKAKMTAGILAEEDTRSGCVQRMNRLVKEPLTLNPRFEKVQVTGAAFAKQLAPITVPQENGRYYLVDVQWHVRSELGKAK